MLINMIGKKYGKLTVKKRVEDFICPNGKHEVQYYCECDCGGNITTRGRYLRRGTVISCGCTVRVQTYHRKYNTYDLSGEYGIGYTTNTNEKFYFDLEDYDLIKDCCWWKDSNDYIVTTKARFLHREIMNPKDNHVVDHINHNKMDNRKCNLRICTRGENSINRNTTSNNSSGYTGVYYRRDRKKWSARITINGVTHYLGCYHSLEDAIAARKEAEIKYFGEFSYEYSINKNNLLEERIVI